VVSICLNFYRNKVKNVKEGFGVMYFPKEMKYTGFFKNDLMHSTGLYKSPQGDMLLGDFENGRMNGFGEA